MKIAIIGYGNLGRGVHSAILNSSDMTLQGIFTKRDPKSLNLAADADCYSYDDLFSKSFDIDVVINCGGSYKDLPLTTPEIAKKYNVVDSFDTHANIPTHLNNVDKSAKDSNKTAVISVGWDPGLFSVARLYEMVALPEGKNYTFWGKGVSQGHSDAIRRIEGVLDARQYTIPKEETLKSIRLGDTKDFTTREKHERYCYVVAEEGADKNLIEKQIKEMPNYFSEYDTTVEFISKEEMDKNHKELPHGGVVIRSGKTGFSKEYNNNIEFSLKLDSNPFFTGSILVSFARAIYRLNKEGIYGCKTIFDIPPIYLLEDSREKVISSIL